MIDEQSSASGHDYASDRSAIGAGRIPGGECLIISQALVDLSPTQRPMGITRGGGGGVAVLVIERL